MRPYRPLSLQAITQVTGAAQATSSPGPLLYEWRVLRTSNLSCVYIGKAKNGDSRPLKMYPRVVADLHQSRGVKKIGQVPAVCYFQRNPWGFRWIHHQLEATADRICNQGNVFDERIELHFPRPSVHPTRLHLEEAQAIAAARADPIISRVLANGRWSMRVQQRRDPALLDQVWV